MWNYVSDTSKRQRGVLNQLGRFVGHAGWDDYIESLMRSGQVESEFIDTDTILAETLRSGDIIELSWNPGRIMKIVALGNNRFEVTESVNSKLTEGMTFTALMFSKGVPMTCTDVRNGRECHESYIAGAKAGITSLRLNPIHDSAARQN